MKTFCEFIILTFILWLPMIAACCIMEFDGIFIQVIVPTALLVADAHLVEYYKKL